jgi:acyl-CoA oxidase
VWIRKKPLQFRKLIRVNAITMIHPTESIKAERQSPSFPIREMTYFLDGGEKQTQVLLTNIAQGKNHASI